MGRDVSSAEATDRVFSGDIQTVPAGESRVLVVAGMAAFAVILNGGTATYQPCDGGGTVIPGSTQVAVTSEERVEAPWPFVLIEATTQDCVAAAL